MLKFLSLTENTTRYEYSNRYTKYPMVQYNFIKAHFYEPILHDYYLMCGSIDSFQDHGPEEAPPLRDHRPPASPWQCTGRCGRRGVAKRMRGRMGDVEQTYTESATTTTTTNTRGRCSIIAKRTKRGGQYKYWRPSEKSRHETRLKTRGNPKAHHHQWRRVCGRSEPTEETANERTRKFSVASSESK